MSSPIKVKCVNEDKAEDEVGILKNISVTGAFGFIGRSLPPGTKVRIFIKVPLTGRDWMSYPAEVLRTEDTASEAGIAVRFTTSWPTFIGTNKD